MRIFALALALLGSAPAPAQIRLMDEPALLVPGRTAVVPIEFEGRSDPRAPFAVRLRDGRVLRAEVHRLIAEPAGSGASPLQRWLGTGVRWRSAHNDDTPEPPPPGTWVAVIELPEDATGAAITLNQSPAPVIWVRVGDPGAAPPEAWAPVFDRAPDPGTLEAVASAVAQDPASRWRARLIRGELSPSRDAERRVFEDPVVEALAHHTEAIWQAALVHLWRADPGEAQRVRRRLGQFVTEPRGSLVPAWLGSTQSLLEALVDPAFDDEARVLASSVWRESSPGARAWVIDDAGLAGNAPVATIGLTNLAERTRSAWVTDPAGVTLTEPELLEPGRTRVARVEPIAGPASSAVLWTARVGEQTFDLPVVPRALPVQPPGLSTGAWLEDWTMRAWLRGERAEAPVSAAAVLRRGLASPNEPAGAGWSLFVRAGAFDDGGSLSAVRIWLGPRGAPRSLLRVEPDGRVIDEVRRTELVGGARAARDEAGVWACDIPIPAEAVEPDGTLRIGLELLTSDGVRLSWPRAQFPWDAEPARLAVRTTAWTELEGIDDE
ncbi:MAG: hypothetical protein ACF8SC_00100 [Phycisphaerales bacterium JB037]